MLDKIFMLLVSLKDVSVIVVDDINKNVVFIEVLMNIIIEGW